MPPIAADQLPKSLLQRFYHSDAQALLKQFA
jgi:hypothetical protein